MSVSLPARLALLVVVLAASLMAMLYKVHKATQFTVIDRGELADLPAENTALHHKKGTKHKDAKDKNLEAIKFLDGRRKMMKKEQVIDNVHNTTTQRKEEEDKPMNIILFYADDWRHDTLGAAGNPIVKTPVLDALAEEGIRFTENCVTTSICWVSRVTFRYDEIISCGHNSRK